MKEILIINLTRMGDLVQTTPTMAGFKDNFPGVRITLLTNPAFSEICKYIPYIDRLFTLEIETILEDIRNKDLVHAYRYIQNTLGNINDTTYDRVINFTHSSPSAVLTSMVSAKDVRGLSIDREGYSIKRHPWIKYFFNVIPARNYSTFHLCDVYTKAGGVIPSSKGLHLRIPEDAEAWVADKLRNKGIKANDLVIGLQLGASAEERIWPISSFATLANRLVETYDAHILLTGSPKEGKYGKEFEASAQTKPLNFIGKTDLQELAALVKRCDLLISNDTGPLHIATAVGTRVLGIYLQSAHFRETGPYGTNHYVIESKIPCSPCHAFAKCNNMICKKVINANNVFELVKLILDKGKVTSIDDSPLWKDIQVYRSYFEKDGLIEYQPLIRRSIQKRELFTHIYRQTWLKILDRKKPEDTAPIIQHLMENLHDWYDFDSRDVSGLAQDELKNLIRLQVIANIALSKVSFIVEEAKKPSPEYRWIKETWEGVPAMDREIENIGRSCPPLKPLSIIFQYGKEGLEGKDLALLAESTCSLYRELLDHVSMIIQILTRLADLPEQTDTGNSIRPFPFGTANGRSIEKQPVN